MNPEVDKFLKQTKKWQKEIAKLRAIVLKTKLEENLKWNLPCYSHNGSNVAIIQTFKAYLGMMFFRGSLLKDPKGVLISNGPNSQAARRFEFRSIQDIVKMAPTIKAYIREAMDIEESGQKVEFKKKPEPLPAELKKAFAKNLKLKEAFNALTPGRQRAYILYFSSAKQSSTRLSRIEKCTPSILGGKGLNDR